MIATRLTTSFLRSISQHCKPFRARVISLSSMASIEEQEYNKRWEEKFWSGGLKPGEAFDAGSTPPALVELLEAGDSIDAAGKRAFVPGCGRGYDLLALLAAGCAEAVGLDLAPSAVVEAEAFLGRELGRGNGDRKARAVQGDFFTYEDAGGPFDLGFGEQGNCVHKHTWVPAKKEKKTKKTHRLLYKTFLFNTMIFVPFFSQTTLSSVHCILI
jgi:hypothetical protein